MPRVSGTYNLPAGYKAEPGQTIRSSQHNPPLEDLAQAMTNSLPRDGSAGMVGNLPMGGNKVTGLAAGTASSDAVRKDQVTPYSGFLNAVSALTAAANQIPYATGAATAAMTALTSFGRTLIAASDAAAARTALGLGTAATADVVDEDSFATNSATRPPSQQSTKAYIGAMLAQTLGVNGSTKIGDLTVNWGQRTGSGSVTFNRPFTSAFYVAVVCQETGASSDVEATYHSPTTTGMEIRSFGGSRSVSYIALGR